MGYVVIIPFSLVWTCGSLWFVVYFRELRCAPAALPFSSSSQCGVLGGLTLQHIGATPSAYDVWHHRGDVSMPTHVLPSALTPRGSVCRQSLGWLNDAFPHGEHKCGAGRHPNQLWGGIYTSFRGLHLLGPWRHSVLHLHHGNNR